MWNHKRRLIDQYESFLESYDELHFEEQRNKYLAALGEVPLTTEDSIADFGCGTGMFTRHVSKHVGKAVGVDLSRKQLLWAKHRSSEACSYVQADLERPPFKENVFDYVFSFTVLHHVNELSLIIRLLTSFAKKGVVVTFLKSLEAAKNLKSAMEGFKGLRIIDSELLKDVIILVDVAKKGE